MLWGSFTPWAMRRSLYLVPEGWLQYSSRLQAASMPRVPRFTAIITSVPAFFAQEANSLTPTRLGSVLRQASSSRRGRWATGPTLSSQ